MKKSESDKEGARGAEPKIVVSFRLPAQLVYTLRKASKRLGYKQNEFIEPVLVASLPSVIKELEKKRRKELDSDFKFPLTSASHDVVHA